MTYGKSYRFKSAGRRFRRRGSRTLSNRRIFSRRSSRAQAVQIAAIRNRVNRVYRACKPEKKVILDASAADWTLDSGMAGSNTLSASAPTIDVGAADYQRVGNKIYRRDYFFLTFEYYNTSETGYHTSESSGTPIRIIVGRWKQPHGSTAVPLLTDLIGRYSASGVNNRISAVAPFVNCVSQHQVIYSDYRFSLSTSKNTRTLKIKTPWYLCTFDTPNSEANNHAWLWLVASDLEYDDNFKEYVKVNMIRKTAFTDA